MFATDDTITAIATPAGRGGIGIVRISGPRAAEIAADLTAHPGRTLEPRHATFGRVHAASGDAARFDQVVCLYFPAPHSYTGDDVVEISAHGSPVVLDRIVEEALRLGARRARPGEFTLRAYLNRRLDLVQAEAVADLIDAVTPAQARIAFDQLEGGLTSAIVDVRQSILDVIAPLEASLDFPDEGFHFVTPGAAQSAVTAIQDRIGRLLSEAAVGRVVRDGARVVLAGRANVGKSSLFNALLGSDRAIVTPIAGTTRDLVVESWSLDGIPVTLVDTAGHGTTEDIVEREGIARAARARESADLRVIVLDASEPLRDEDVVMLGQVRPGHDVVVANKIDLPPRWDPAGVSVTTAPVLPVSAASGAGLDVLRGTMVRTLVGKNGADDLRDVPRVGNRRHIALLEDAQEHLSRAAGAIAAGASEELAFSRPVWRNSVFRPNNGSPDAGAGASGNFLEVLYWQIGLMTKSIDAIDVVVVGAGHAGCEAAWAAVRLGQRVGLCSLASGGVAQMPCNPAIGGTAKGHLVREIDAFGGLMGEAIDATGLQFKMLNRSRGPAVWSPRAQADKRRYSSWMAARLASHRLLQHIDARVASVCVDERGVSGVVLEDGSLVRARAVVITTGTFLNGLIHIGPQRTPAGRYGEAPAIDLAESLKSLGFRWGRLKTGTPPRLHRRSIDFAKLTPQFGDEPPVPFSLLTPAIHRPQIVCHLLHTTERVHDLVRQHLGESPLYNGQICGIGPRYCPSLEDKVMRFPDKERHQLFLEPEGLDVDEIYVNGFSMSLPAHVQAAIVRALPGLEAAEVIRPGYAVEYDFVQPTELRRTLETKAVSGLFLAGQLNGTSGYEEAAGQGLVAGVNAALHVRGEAPMVIGRDEAYLGVMIDDLTTQGCLEPYRMFTSRAEHRLLLRADNADLRLTPRARALGMVDEERWVAFATRRDMLATKRRVLEETLVRTGDGARVPAAQLLRQPKIRLNDLVLAGHLGDFDAADRELLTLETDLKYSGYLKRQTSEVERCRRAEDRLISKLFDYDRVIGLSREVRERLHQARPETLGQAGRVPGVTPAAVALIARHIEHHRTPIGA